MLQNAILYKDKVCSKWRLFVGVYPVESKDSLIRLIKRFIISKQIRIFKQSLEMPILNHWTLWSYKLMTFWYFNMFGTKLNTLVHLKWCANLKNAHFGPYECWHYRDFLHFSFLSISIDGLIQFRWSRWRWKVGDAGYNFYVRYTGSCCGKSDWKIRFSAKIRVLRKT